MKTCYRCKNKLIGEYGINLMFECSRCGTEECLNCWQQRYKDKVISPNRLWVCPNCETEISFQCNDDSDCGSNEKCQNGSCVDSGDDKGGSSLWIWIIILVVLLIVLLSYQ